MNVRQDFPIFEKYPSLIYLDSACTSLKPRTVVDAISSYYLELGACGSRSSHLLGRKTNEKTAQARQTVASFVGAAEGELVWTRNTTEGLNIVANGLDYTKRKKVVTSEMEHHSALLPLMRLSEQGKISLTILPCDGNGEVPLEKWEGAIDRQTALVLTNNGNNTTGCEPHVEEVAKMAHDNGALACIDGAQGVPHHKQDFKKSGFDFLCFSAHKMLGPTGIGALICKGEHMEKLSPLMYGGGTVKTVSGGKAIGLPGSERLEAGIQHYSGMLGFASACDYLRKTGMGKIEEHEKAISQKLEQAILSSGAQIYGVPSKSHSALFSFNFKNAKPHDVALLLDKQNIAVRSGFFCAQMAMEAMGAKNGAVRASCYLYNTDEEIRKLQEALAKIGQLY